MGNNLDKSLFEQFKNTGRDIFLRGLISSHAGNMSIRTGNRMYITKKASILGQLNQKDIIELSLKDADDRITMASSEVAVHRAIYANTSALAVVHAHPPYATLLSMVESELIPVDSEGSCLLKKVPVIVVQKTIGSEEAASIVSEHLRNYRIVLLHGHGSFARGDTLEEAHMLTSSLESSSFFLYHLPQYFKAKRIGRFSDKYKKLGT